MEERAWQVCLVADSAGKAAEIRETIGRGVLGKKIHWLVSSWDELKVPDLDVDLMILVEAPAGSPALAWLLNCCPDSLPPVLYLVDRADVQCEQAAERAGALLIELAGPGHPGLLMSRAVGQLLRQAAERHSLVLAQKALAEHRGAVHQRDVELQQAQAALADCEHRLLASQNERLNLVYMVESLLDSEETFRATFDNASVGISHISPLGKWIRVNDRLCEITGYSREELLRSSFQEITYPGDLEDDLYQMQRMLRGEIARYQLEKRYIRKDGQVVWIHLSASLQRDEYGQPAYIISIIQDISERKRLQAHDHFLIEMGERLARAQSQAQMIELCVEGMIAHLQASRCLFFEFDPAGETLQAYPPVAPAENIPPGPYPLSLIPPVILEGLRQMHQEVVEDVYTDPRTRAVAEDLNELFGTRSFVHTPFARERAWAGMLSISFDTPCRWEEIDLSLLRSITDLLWLNIEKIRLLDSLRESEERLRLALSSSGVTVFGQDAGLRETWIYNPDAAQSKQSVLGLSNGELLAPEDAARLHSLKQHVLETGETVRQEVEFEMAGRRYSYQLVIEPARRSDGEINGILSSALDISERRQAEEAIREYARRLERSNRDLEDFAFIASHDLQEPLRKVRSFSQLLKSDYFKQLDDNARSYLDRMVNAAERMQRMINDLLAYSRISTQGKTFTPVDLREVANEVLGDLELRIEQSGGQVEVGALPEVEGDRLQLQQLLQNLIGNALKFQQPDRAPRVRLSARHQSAHTIELIVEDNGIGFSERHLERIFQPFQRLHSRSEYEGSGIGLAICRKIAERHGGSITATSRPGDGSQFIVTLPVKHS